MTRNKLGRSAQTLIAWRHWIGAVKPHCEYAVDDVNKCSHRICPCDRKLAGDWYDRQIKPWLDVGAGQIGGFWKFRALLDGRRHDNE